MRRTEARPLLIKNNVSGTIKHCIGACKPFVDIAERQAEEMARGASEAEERERAARAAEAAEAQRRKLTEAEAE